MTRALKQPSSGSASCSWCDRPFQLRQSGGHAQRFCTPRCRLAFHAAARRSSKRPAQKMLSTCGGRQSRSMLQPAAQHAIRPDEGDCWQLTPLPGTLSNRRHHSGRQKGRSGGGFKDQNITRHLGRFNDRTGRFAIERLP
jgi:hypothetical protein